MQYRIGNLELRKTETISENPLQYLEIVRWLDDGHCITIASWNTDKDGDFPSLEFCIDRPFDSEVNMETFLELVKLGYDIYNFREVPKESLN